MQMLSVSLSLVLLDRTVIGRFILSPDDHKWTFRYDESFKNLNLSPLLEFSDISKIYNASECIGWLSGRVVDVSCDDKELKILASIKSLDGKDNFPLTMIVES